MWTPSELNEFELNYKRQMERIKEFARSKGEILVLDE